MLAVVMHPRLINVRSQRPVGATNKANLKTKPTSNCVGGGMHKKKPKKEFLPRVRASLYARRQRNKLTESKITIGKHTAAVRERLRQKQQRSKEKITGDNTALPLSALPSLLKSFFCLFI
ncbi:hypothetical protein L596_002223 [Steinernema carpocapsae]|uniref:Uncharacterized protein n=1 Tax=Steinernema carpocapsae TaxID=34508 RepID=A0A4U8UQJ9_STECR|nr:hypothetical protein L596_002223 [Steinernema carpocapsae]